MIPGKCLGATEVPPGPRCFTHLSASQAGWRITQETGEGFGEQGATASRSSCQAWGRGVSGERFQEMWLWDLA